MSMPTAITASTDGPGHPKGTEQGPLNFLPILRRVPGWAEVKFSNEKAKFAVAGAVLLALVCVPAPLLPPHRLAQALQSLAGVEWKAAYLAAGVGLHAGFYGSLGVLAAFAVNRAPTLSGRSLQILIVPFVIVGVALAIRSMKLGYLPVWVNAAVPVAACLCGVGLGLGLLYRRWKVIPFIAVAVIGLSLWGLFGGASAELNRATQAHLRRLVAAGPGLASGEARFGVLLQTAFASTPADSTMESAVQQNRAAILAWGIALGHERLARWVGLDRDAELERQAVALRQGTTLRGREDWPRHYALSAALAVLEHPLVSDAGGLMKEQLDAMTGGSGFSFADLAADRAGVRFATAATRSEAAAKAMQARLRDGFRVDDFFPPAADLPENLSVGQFRRDYGGVGSQSYRQKIREIETRLDRCVALAPVPFSP